MLCFPEINKPYIIESTDSPIAVKYFWAFSATLADFILKPFTYFEDTIGNAVSVEINNFNFMMPSSWHILIIDPETSMVDTVPIASCAHQPSYAVLMTPSPHDQKQRTAKINIIDFHENENISLVHPMVQKQHALCHPAGLANAHFDNVNNEVHVGVSIGPHDLHKYLNGLTIGNILSY
jgi:hypothetical protein